MKITVTSGRGIKKHNKELYYDPDILQTYTTNYFKKIGHIE